MDGTIFAGASPWQQWGNTQILEMPANPFTNPRLFLPQISLNRIQYNRPETWRFLFSARIIDAPTAGVGEQANASIWFEIFTGIGRSAIHIPFFCQLPGWQWNGAAPVLGDASLLWTNSVQSGEQTWLTDETPQVTTTAPVLTDLIVGQDITVVAHGVFNTDIPGAVPMHVEVSAQWAPNVHVRPDWFQIDGHPAEQFAGGEVKGR